MQTAIKGPSLLLLLVLLFSCGRTQYPPEASLVDIIWTFSQSRPDGLYYFDSVRIFPEDSLEAAVNFGKVNFQKSICILSTVEKILLE